MTSRLVSAIKKDSPNAFQKVRYLLSAMQWCFNFPSIFFLSEVSL